MIDVDKSSEMLHQEVPLWQQAATAWRHFLSDVMGKSFDQTESDVEVER